MLNEDERQLVEEVGRLLEESGLPRVAGRILGWLLICDPPHQTGAELAAAIGASRASISTMTRLLVHGGLVVRAPVPGSRQDHYRLRPDVWSRRTEEGVALVRAYRNLAERGLVLLDGAPAERRQRLVEMRDFFDFYEREVPELLRRWERYRKEAGHAG